MTTDTTRPEGQDLPPLPAPHKRGVFYREYVAIHKGEEWFTAEQVREAQRAAIAAHEARKVQAGWKLVPLTATDEMTIAAQSAYESDIFGNKSAWPSDIYRVMVAAAPSAPAPAAEDDKRDAGPTDEQVRAMLAVRWPALYRDSLFKEYDGPQMRAETEMRIKEVRAMYAAAMQATKEKQ